MVIREHTLEFAEVNLITTFEMPFSRRHMTIQTTGTAIQNLIDVNDRELFE